MKRGESLNLTLMKSGEPLNVPLMKRGLPLNIPLMKGKYNYVKIAFRRIYPAV
jgi:hypothetical protein